MPLTEEIDISLSWVVSLIVVLGLVVELLLPQAIVAALPGGQAIAGLISDVGALTLALVVGVLIVLGWTLSARFGEGSASTASSTAEKVEDRFERFAQEWLTVTRLVATALIAFAFMFLSQLGSLLGVVGQYIAEAPVVGAQLVTIGLGWLALGADVPVVGPLVAGMTPKQWMFVGFVLLGLGVAVKNA